MLQRGLGYSYYFVGRHPLHEQSRGLVCAYLMVFVSQYSDLILLISFQRYFHSHFGYLSKKNELNHTDLLFLSHLSVLLRLVDHVLVVEVTEYILMAEVRHVVDSYFWMMQHQEVAS